MTNLNNQIQAVINKGLQFSFEPIFICKVNRDGWECFKWTCVFKIASSQKTIALDMHMGLAHVKPNTKTPKAPELASVINSLILDADCASEDFDFFCDNLGYSNDSIKARKIYESCKESGEQLKLLFNESQIAELRILLEDY